MKRFNSPNLSIESLERRDLMAADISLADGLLSVKGTNDRDDIVVQTTPSPTASRYQDIDVTIKNEAGSVLKHKSYQSYLVSSIRIECFNGNDIATNNTNKPSEILGGDGFDILTGGSNADTIWAALSGMWVDSGNSEHPNQLFGNGGNDTLYGGDGVDVIHGGEGSDHLYGEANDDFLFGDKGMDFLFGQLGKDELWGGDDNDYLYGEGRQFANTDLDQSNTLHGDGGSDHLYGARAKDIIFGDAGKDFIYGGLGDDDLFGGENDDEIFGGGGNDNIWGGAGKDKIFGEAGDDHLYGESGNDKVYGGDGNDYCYGGDDNDVIDGEAGSDHIYGEAGVDGQYFEASDTVNGVPGWVLWLNPFAASVTGLNVGPSDRYWED